MRLIILSVTVFYCVFLSAVNYYVSPSGNDANTGTLESPRFNISSLVNLVNPGDTIFVLPGQYNYNSITNAYNYILNCDSYNNCDSHKSGGNTDGFACKLFCGPGNLKIYQTGLTDVSTINFKLERSTVISLDVVDVQRRIVMSCVSRQLFPVGDNYHIVYLGNLQPGIYMARLSAENKVLQTLKFLR